MRRAALSVCLAVAALAMTGCGHLGADYKGMRLVPGGPLEQQMIERYPVGTPQRTVLEYFRALQRNDFARALTFYAADVHVTPDVLRFETYHSRFFREAQPPKITSVWSRPGRTTVFTLVEFRWSAPDGRGYVWVYPQAFELKRSGGGWRLIDNYFVLATGSAAPTGPCSTC